jgi:hypothetical protein
MYGAAKVALPRVPYGRNRPSDRRRQHSDRDQRKLIEARIFVETFAPPVLPNNSMQRTALRAAADAERWKYHRKADPQESCVCDSLYVIFDVLQSYGYSNHIPLLSLCNLCFGFR